MAGIFSLASCTPPPPDSLKKSPGQERLEQSLSVATQITGQIEEAFHQSCLLAEMSREWSRIDPAASEKGFQLAWQMALAARERARQAQVLREIASRWPDEAKASQDKVHFNTVLDLRDELQAIQGRTWALRAVAEEWVQANPRGGRLALEFATGEALAMSDPEIRDRELRSIAEAWAGVDGMRSLDISRSISDPLFKAMALTRIALFGGDRGRAGDLLNEAWRLMEKSPPSHSQAKTAIGISAMAVRLFPQSRKDWLDRTLLQIQRLKDGQPRAFAMQELVLHWAPIDFEQVRQLTLEIPPAYPEERAFALIHLAKGKGVPKAKAMTLLKEAHAEALRISDPFEAQKARALILLGLSHLDPRGALQLLSRVEDSFHRSEVLGALALQISERDKGRALELAQTIPLEPFRMRIDTQVLGAWIGREKGEVDALYQEALQATTAIADPYTRALFLIETAKNWGRIERGKGPRVLELALASSERISTPWMTTGIIAAIAEGLRGEDPAKARLLLDGIEPSLLRIRRAISEIQRWAPVDPQRAKELAEAFPPDFPYEKAMALGEAAGGMKRTDPRGAFDLYERALDQILNLPLGYQVRKTLVSLVSELARLDKERTLRRIQEVSDLETRDLLLKEAGGLWAEEDPLFAMKAAQGVAEGALRVALYQRMADRLAKQPFPPARVGTDLPGRMALTHWGLGREKAKKEESQAVPHYEKALQEIRKISNPAEQSFLLSSLAADWAALDEEKALQVAETIPSNLPEPLSGALLQVGIQLKKWNRKGAEDVFQKTVSAAVRIQDSGVRAKRLFKTGQQWQEINHERGEEVLRMAEKEARKGPASEERARLLAEILLARSINFRVNSQGLSTLFQSGDSPSVRARVLIDQARIQSERTVEESMKTLERAVQYAQKTRNDRLMAELAPLWYILDPGKGLDLCNQIGSRELQIKVLCGVAQRPGAGRKEESRPLLERAIEEALRVQGERGKIESLRAIAGILVNIDKERAKAVYQIAYQVVKRSAFY
jgi:hypothetical protein